MSLILQYDLSNPKRLPNGYTPVAYIESSGTLYIDTGWYSNFTKGFKVIAEYSFSSSGTRGCILSNYNEGSYKISFELDSGKSRMWCYNGTKDTSSSTLSADGKHMSIFEYNTTNYIHICDGTTVSNLAVSWTGINEYSAYIFLDRAARTSTFNKNFKLYSLKICDGNVLVRNFIPCYNGSVYGLFDIVTLTFYGNSGTGSFTGGPEVRVLPAEYLLVEYLESTGTLWINTGLSVTSSNGNSYAFEAMITPANLNNGLAYSVIAGVDSNTLIAYTSAGKASIGNATSSSVFFSAGTRAKVSCTFATSALTYYVNGSSTGLSRAINSSNSIYLFADYGGSYPAKCKIEYAIFGSSAKFIPCYRRSDGKPGMYDLCGSTCSSTNSPFYPNSGTGEFILGPTVEESSRLLEWNNIGGDINLLTGKTPTNNASYKTVPTSGSDEGLTWNNICKVTKGTTVTASFDAYSETSGINVYCFFYNNTSGYVLNSLTLCSTGQTSTGGDGSIIISMTTTKTRYWITWTMESDTSKLDCMKHLIIGRVYYSNNTSYTGKKVYISNVKLHWGKAGNEDYTSTVGLPTNVHSYQLNSAYDPGYYTESDGSQWIHIAHHDNPASYLFSSTDNFAGSFYTDSHRWWDMCKCNDVDKWEIMVKQKATSSSTEVKYRWIQTCNPMTCSYSDVHGKVTQITTTGYTTTSTNGGYFKKNSSIYLAMDNNTNGSNWYGFGSWTAYSGGYPGYNQVCPTTGSEDIYLRVDNVNKMEGCYLDTNKSYIVASNTLPISNGSVSFWRKGANVNGWLLFSDSNNKYICASDGSHDSHWSSSAGSPVMYIDGSSTASARAIMDTSWHHYVITGINISGWADLRINAFSNHSSSWNTGGCIKDIKFYDTILSSNDIKALYLAK